ncbi:MAG: bifunctional DNA-formamidopyrimidine glycosylase/DNA-(apurinic or apyrimidinic site) lyase [Candidatus Margulisbacteria bacterium]|nr:bifunctional DNA-formamidopyrimidine glycosylase/DNA-(apurinic or apyrimidinic site) lyase [Candidatus Margulisiibacteriota bacterium]
MPELPEVETIKRGLKKAIVGKKIADFDSDWHKAINKPLRQYQRILMGTKILNVDRRAKMLVLTLLNDWRILVHLKMTGQLVFRDKKKCLIGGHSIETNCENLPNKFTHAIFTFADDSHLYFNDVRKFGWVRLYSANELAKVFEKMQLGPEPLTSEFTSGCLTEIMRQRPKARVKQFIMDPKNLVGVGNIYSDEVCFFARVRPDRRVGTLKDKEIKLIHKGIIKILKAAIMAQGTTFSNYVNTDGEAGAFTKQLKVYQRHGKKCYSCKGRIIKMKIGGRTSSFCPKCQK